MPWTMVAFAIGALSMIGVPPTVGFISKWYIVLGALSQENMFALIVIIMSTLLNAAYFLPIIYMAFLKKADPVADGVQTHGDAPFPILLALGVTAGLTLVLFFVPDIAIDLAKLLIG